jgi:hypothetical protein
MTRESGSSLECRCAERRAERPRGATFFDASAPIVGEDRSCVKQRIRDLWVVRSRALRSFKYAESSRSKGPTQDRLDVRFLARHSRISLHRRLWTGETSGRVKPLRDCPTVATARCLTFGVIRVAIDRRIAPKIRISVKTSSRARRRRSAIKVALIPKPGSILFKFMTRCSFGDPPQVLGAMEPFHGLTVCDAGRELRQQP